MKNKVFYIFISLICLSLKVFADAYVPDFDTMQTYKCEIKETIYNQDNSISSENNIFRIFKLDDENSKLYLQKEPLSKVSYYGLDKIEFDMQSMTDDCIIMSHTIINRSSNEYSSNSVITYDNPIFGVRHSKSVGTCKIIN